MVWRKIKIDIKRFIYKEQYGGSLNQRAAFLMIKITIIILIIVIKGSPRTKAVFLFCVKKDTYQERFQILLLK